MHFSFFTKNVSKMIWLKKWMYFSEDVRERGVKWDSYLIAHLDILFQLEHCWVVLTQLEGRQSCAHRRGFMGFSNEIWHPNCLPCTLQCHASEEDFCSYTLQEQCFSARMVIILEVFSFFSEPLQTFFFSTAPKRSHLHHCVSQGPTRKQKHPDF